MASGLNSGAEEVKIDRFSWFSEHPKYHEMLSWGFDDSSQIISTLLVYLDLCEGKNWWHTEIYPCWPLRMAYITGKPNKKDDTATVLPIQAKASLSPSRLRAFLANIDPEQNNHQNSSKTPSKAVIPEEHRAKRALTLAITDTDSTIVYYKISDGLVAPDSGPKLPVDAGSDDGGEEEGRGKGRSKGRAKGVKRKAGRGASRGAGLNHGAVS